MCIRDRYLFISTLVIALFCVHAPRGRYRAPVFCTYARAPFWNDTMDRAYLYNKVRSLLAVFVAFEVLNDEDKKLGRGTTRQWIKRRMNGAISRTSWRNWRSKTRWNIIKLKIWCEWIMPIFNEYWATSNRILLENKFFVGIKLFLRKKD